MVFVIYRLYNSCYPVYVPQATDDILRRRDASAAKSVYTPRNMYKENTLVVCQVVEARGSLEGL